MLLSLDKPGADTSALGYLPALLAEAFLCFAIVLVSVQANVNTAAASHGITHDAGIVDNNDKTGFPPTSFRAANDFTEPGESYVCIPQINNISNLVANALLGTTALSDPLPAA